MEHDTASQQRGYAPPPAYQPTTDPAPEHQPPVRPALEYEPPAGSAPEYGPPAGPAPEHEPVPAPEPEGPAVGTLVWGLTVLFVAALVALWELTDVRVDLSVVVPAAMLGLGLLLVVGAVLSALRHRP